MICNTYVAERKHCNHTSFRCCLRNIAITPFSNAKHATTNFAKATIAKNEVANTIIGKQNIATTTFAKKPMSNN